MAQREMFYTDRHLEELGLYRLKQHIEEYLAGTRTVPVARAPGPGYHVDITLSDKLLELLLHPFSKVDKPLRTAVKYGYREHSRGGKNGIFQLRENDSGMLRKSRGLINGNLDAIIQDLQQSDIKTIEPVKVVWHSPDGTRIIGAMNPENHRIFLLDFAQY